MRIFWSALLIILTTAIPTAMFYKSFPTTVVNPNYHKTEEVPIMFSYDVYTVPVKINNAIQVDFIVDSGASKVLISPAVLTILKENGSIEESDMLPDSRYQTASGYLTVHNLKIKQIQVGNLIVHNVEAAVGPEGGPLLLGQSFLHRFKSWGIDNSSNRLILGNISPIK